MGPDRPTPLEDWDFTVEREQPLSFNLLANWYLLPTGATEYLRQMHAIAEKTLESICVHALNMVQRAKSVSAIEIEATPSATVNWTLRKVQPRLALADVRKSHEKIRALQREYHLST